MFYGVLLAGGLSSRMGQDKSQLTIDGFTLLEHSLNLLQSCGAEEICISGDVEGFEGVPDIIEHCGPLGGLYSTLAFIKESKSLDNTPFILIPVDMPLLSVESLNRIIAGIGDEQCCHFSGEVFPCAMRASQFLYDYLKEAFAESTKLGGKRSMKGLMHFLEPNIVPTDGLAEEVFLNINKPQDWELFKQRPKNDRNQ